MKLFWIGLLAMLATAGDYRIVDLKPQESQELTALQASVDSAQKNLEAAQKALSTKRITVCVAHGLSKQTCDANGYGWMTAGSLVLSTSTGNYGPACRGWDAEYKHLIVDK